MGCSTHEPRKDAQTHVDGNGQIHFGDGRVGVNNIEVDLRRKSVEDVSFVKCVQLRAFVKALLNPCVS